jgi:hypothetical protein
MTQKFDRWYEQEMRAPDGSYIKRLQDVSISPEEAFSVMQDMVIREAMNHYYARDAQSLEQLIRRLVSQQP